MARRSGFRCFVVDGSGVPAGRVRPFGHRCSSLRSRLFLSPSTLGNLTMNLSTLLSGRTQLLHQAHLANLALAHEILATFAGRIATARLRGRVLLCFPSPEEERPWATLTALDGAQSVLEEHFTDPELMDLADVLRFLLTQDDEPDPTALEFRWESFASRFLDPVRARLQRAGVRL